MKDVFNFAVAAAVILGVAGCGPKPPTSAERTAKTFLAEKPIQIGPKAADALELVDATPGAHTDSDFVVVVKLKLRKDLDWENIFILGDTLEGPDRHLGKGDQFKISGPKNAGGTVEIKIRMDRDGAEGQRVFLIRSVAQRGEFE